MKFGIKLSRGNGGWTVYNRETKEVVGRWHRRVDALFDRDGRNDKPRRKPTNAEPQVRYYTSNLGGAQIYNAHKGNLLKIGRLPLRDARGLAAVLNFPLNEAVL